MITKQTKYFNPRRLAVIFFLMIIPCLISTPSLIWADYAYRTEIIPSSFFSAKLWGVNEKGDVIGTGSNGTIVQAFIYSNGTYTLLPPPDDSFSAADVGWGINKHGVVVGTFYDNSMSEYKAFIYSKGIYTPLLPNNLKNIWAYSINDRGDVVGFGADSASNKTKAFIYRKGAYTIFEAFSEGPTDAVSINNKGDVVGFGIKNGFQRGFLYRGGIITEIGPPGWNSSIASGINDRGDVVGYGCYDDDDNDITVCTGFIYSGEAYTIFPPIDSYMVRALRINDKGVVIGDISNGTVRSFVYEQGNYTELLPCDCEWIEVSGINKKGVVVGSYDDGGLKGFIATPLPEK